MRLKPIGRYKESLKSFYLVNYHGEEYKVRMWNFQSSRKGLPDFVDCIVTEFPTYVKISQDQTTLIRELYQAGQTYPFRVKNKLRKWYNVVDINGLTFRLPYSELTPRLLENQSIEAKVKSVDGMKVRLELARNISGTSVQFKTVDTISEEARMGDGAAELIARLMSTSQFLADANTLYESEDPIWVFEAALGFDKIMLQQDSSIDTMRLLPVLQRLCFYLLEESDMLRRMTDTGRERWIPMLNEVAGHADMYAETCRIIEENNERNYVDRQLSNLKESENLYQPERKFRIIMTIFNRHDELMDEMTDRIFDIILDGNKEHWLAEPFRTAFVDMLEIFIATHRGQAGLSPGSTIAQKMIKAIAIQLLLSNHEDNIDRRLNRTTYYRLLATQQHYDSVNILDDAFNCLFSDYDEDLEYDWEDIQSVDSLYIKASVRRRKTLSAKTFWRQVYRTDLNELIVEDSGVTIRPIIGRHSTLLPPGLLEWHNLDIRGSLGIKTKFKSSTNLNMAIKVWKEIEENLAHKPVTGLYRKHTPDVGDVVVIRILETSDDNLSFYCEIDDEHFAGHGWIKLSEIARYMGANDRNLAYFSDDDGNPTAFEAIVTQEPDRDDNLEFSMTDLVDDHFRQTHYAGDTLLCNVRAIDRYDKLSYVCFSDDGASCIVRNDGSLRLLKNDIIKVRLIEFTQTGQLVCEFVERSPEQFNIIDAFKNLLADISLDAPQQQALPEEQMTGDVMTELIGIIDRLAVCADTRISTYGFLSLASILAEIGGDDATSRYYDERRTLVRLFDDYETNGRIDEDKLHSVEEKMDGQSLQTDFYVNEALTKFRILTALRHKASVDELIEISRSTTSTAIRDAADMAVALILTARFELPNIQRQLEDRINKLLGVNIKTSNLKDYGIETQEMEFKSSIVYPAGAHMQAQPKTQEAVIMRVICGFLNSDRGGTLYLGVNKAGAACGVQNDMRYLDNTDEDGYGRYVHNMINRDLGTIANQCCVDCSWEDDQGYKIYVMKIKPSPELIRYDKVCWIRQDTETRPLPEDKAETFAAMHLNAYRKFFGLNDNDEPIVAEQESAKTKDTGTSKASELYHIATSHWRKNVVLDYEEDYGNGTVAYLHFLPGEQYMLTDDFIREETHLSLAIQEEEASGYLLVGYESGHILLVEMSDLLNKTRNRRYLRCKGEKPVYACPMRRDDLVLTAWESTRGETLIRIDETSDLIARHIDGDMNSSGALVSDTKFNRFVSCDVVKGEYRQRFQKYRNQGDGLGQKASARSLSDIELMKELLGAKRL